MVTAPGQDATHSPAPTISSMPSPMTRSGQASRPNGMAIRLSTAMGMIRRLTSGAAIRLAIKP
jgi:hypothetical protein